METRNLPGTELDLSVVGFGAWAIGGDYWGDDVTDERSIGAVHKALDVGINWFDTDLWEQASLARERRSG